MTLDELDRVIKEEEAKFTAIMKAENEGIKSVVGSSVARTLPSQGAATRTLPSQGAATRTRRVLWP